MRIIAFLTHCADIRLDPLRDGIRAQQAVTVTHTASPPLGDLRLPQTEQTGGL